MTGDSLLTPEIKARLSRQLGTKFVLFIEPIFAFPCPAGCRLEVEPIDGGPVVFAVMRGHETTGVRVAAEYGFAMARLGYPNQARPFEFVSEYFPMLALTFESHILHALRLLPPSK